MSKMSPEKARELRDTGGHRPRGGAVQPTDGRKYDAFISASGLQKHRVLRFDARYPADVAKAQVLLGGLPDFTVARGPGPHVLLIRYAVNDYTLEGIAKALGKQGFHLDNAWCARLARAFIAFFEETQLRNLYGPQRLIKKSQDIYSKAWDHHMHGDHDDTPAELRQDK
ncbi:MAG: hypothetical protein WA112_08310 [Rugosibacter sp.]|jgi:hypothetical protein